MIKLLCALVNLLLVAGVLASPLPPPVVVRNVNVVDVSTGRVVPDSTVIIRGGRIARVGKYLKVPKNAQVVDGTGKYLIPGLWDMHVHIFSNVSAPGTDNKDDYFPLFIANGVTGVRDTFTDADDLKILSRWRAEINGGKMIGPRVVGGSPIIDGVPVLQPNSVGVANDVEARTAVRESKASGSAFIKVYENLSRESYYAIADESKKLGLPFIGHVPNSLTPQEASDAGQKSIEHLTRMMIACSSDESNFKNIKNQEWTPELRRKLFDSFSEQKCGEVARLFVKNGTWHDPTLVEEVGRFLGDDGKLAADDRLRFVSKAEVEGWLKFSKRFSPDNRKMRESVFQRSLEIVKIMHRAGVPLLAGTDVGNPYVYAGSSLHDELAWLVRAGLTPHAALQTATLNPAKFLGMESSLGTIAEGKIADLVLLDADPLADINNTKKINAVITDGKLLRRAELDAMLRKAEKPAGGN
jgi:imidazolonepropionase-like amidohydrolase